VLSPARLALAGGALLVAAVPAAALAGWADGGDRGVAQTDQLTATISVVATDATTIGGQGPTASAGDGPSSCAWVPVATPPPAGQQLYVPQTPTVIAGPAGATGTWYTTCTPGGVAFVPTGAQVQQVVSPRQLAAQALAEIHLPAPPVQLSPGPPHMQIVRVPTWAWVGAEAWAPRSASATAGPVTVSATATPVSMGISYLDGSHGWGSVTCDGPGTPYSDALAQARHPELAVRATSPDCGWTYERSSASAPDESEPISAHVTYSVTSTIGPLGTLDSPTTTVSVKVGEVQTLIEPPAPGGQP